MKQFRKEVDVMVDEELRSKTESEQILRENLAAWNEMNKDYLEEFNREVDKEIDERYDISKVPEPSAYGFDGRPLRR